MTVVRDDYDLIYIVRKISHYNFFTYYVGLALIWAAFIRFTDEPIVKYELFEVSYFQLYTV